jgi:hypothetical protein
MPLRLGPDEREALFETHQGPAPMLDLLGAAALRMAAAAARLGVFQALSEAPADGPALAGRVGADPRGLGLLLEALRAHGYVERGEDGRWSNTAASGRWLVRNGTPGFTDTLEFWDALLFGLWPTLERSLVEGRPPVDWYRWLEENPRVLRSFQGMLGGMARRAGPAIAEAAALPAGARRLLDVGGSHALYSAAFCRANPELAATVLDFPGAVAIGRENAAAEGLEGRISFREADFLSGPLGEGYDAVLLCRIVHGLDAETNRALLGRAFEALVPGGVVLVVEEYDPERRPSGAVSDAFMQTFSLNMYHLQGAQSYPTEEISAWLRHAGFLPESIREVPAGGDRVVRAERPAAS